MCSDLSRRSTVQSNPQIALPTELREELVACGQHHVLRSFDSGRLSDDEKIQFISQLKRYRTPDQANPFLERHTPQY